MTQRLQAGYDRLARWYAVLEWLRFGRALQRTRIALLPCVGRPTRALLLGDGDGRLLAALARRYPLLQITSVDVSPRMLALQQSRVADLGPAGRFQWQCAEVEQLSLPAGHFDLIVTAFFLDCFTDPQLNMLVPRIAQWLSDDGRWLVADFRLPELGWKRLWAQGWLAVMHLFFRVTTGLQSRQLVDPAPKLQTAGLVPRITQRFHWDMLQATLYGRPAFADSMGRGHPRESAI